MVKAVILGLQLLLGLVTWLKQSQAIKAGQDEEIARTATAILQKTDTAKKVMAEVMAMTDSQVDEALRRLEP